MRSERGSPVTSRKWRGCLHRVGLIIFHIKATKLVADVPCWPHDCGMYVPERFLGKRGASVLAAIVLVAILGAVLLVFQYVRSSGDFAYEPSALIATVGEASPSGGNTGTCDYKMQSCSCMSDKTTSSSGTIDQQCLPGCQYRVTNNAGASGPTIEVVGTPTTSTDPKNWSGGTPPPGFLQFCGVTGQCAQQMQCQAGGSLSASQLSEIQAQAGIQAINAASTPGAAAQQVSLYTLQGGDLGYLSADMSSTADAPANVAQEASPNIDAANTQIESLSGASDPIQAAQDSVNLNSDLTDANKLTLPQQDAAQDAAQDAEDEAAQTPPPCTPTNVGSNCSGGSSTFGLPCVAPQTGTQPNCVTPPPAAAPAVPAKTAAPAKSTLSTLESTGLSFLTGLVQGVTRGLATQQATQAAQAAAQAAAPYGVGNNGVACPQPQPQPSSSQCTVGTWQQLYQTNNCPSTWQCVPTNNGATATQPAASISCQPQTADVGMSVSISYACTNATGSTAGGFNTNNQLSGSATAVITAPPSGTNTATYGVTCTNQSLTASAQCSVQINQPSIVLIANPSVVATSSATAIGWVTSGMSACTVSSPDSAAFTAANAGNTSINGVATTPALTSTMHVVLNCVTTGGGTDSAMTTVSVGNAASGASGAVGSSAPLSVSSSADNGSVAHGGSVTVTWSSSNPPAGSAVSLWLVNKQTQAANAVIVGGLAVNGVYTWNVPSIGATCNPEASNVCASDLTQGDSYAIEAVLYTPSNAYVGDGTAPSSPTAPVYGASAVGGTFTLDDTSSSDGSGNSE
jgi:hypothetical protein